MSISDYFNKKTVSQNSITELTKSVESPALVEAINKRNETFYPNVNFADPSTFVNFGSAEEYYRSSIERVYSSYPYDGSEAEKLEFKNNSTYLDQWLLDNKYPKSTGYALFSADGWGSKSGAAVGKYGIPSSKEYIYTAGGIHTASLHQHVLSPGAPTEGIAKAFDKGIIYDPDKNRTQNYKIKPTDGNTIQFWLKKDAFTTEETDREVILDLWNGNTVPVGNDAVAIVHTYGRLTLELSGGLNNSTPNSVVYLTLQSGAYGIVAQPICDSTYNAASIANGEWQHHTVTMRSSDSDLTVKYFINGLLNKKTVFNTSQVIGEIPGKIDGYIGALSTKPSGSTYASATMLGAGKLSGSMDDFRFWKKDLTDEYVYNTWFYPIGGGSNTDDFRTDLGVYYKFNEGIVGSSSYDSIVLDYSGRVSNGRWVGYDTYSRSTGSAFTEVEFGDPIIRSEHPLVKSLQTEMQISGSNYDRSNSSNLYNSVPAWLREEDQENSNIKFLYQILSSYLDTLYTQITELPKLKDKNYFSASAEPYFFIDRLLNDQGLITPNSFIEGDLLEYFWDRNNSATHFDQSVEKTKRLIYNNIYNNLEYIYKTKGTEKSFRNLLRCYGVDDELIKLNVYTDNAKHYIKDRYKDTSYKTKILNLNKKNRTNARVIQTSSSLNGNTFVSASGDTLRLERFSAFSMEGGVTFPKMRPFGDKEFYTLGSVSSSMFGFHQADTTAPQHYAWHTPDDANLQVYAVKNDTEGSNVKFVIKNYSESIYFETDFYEDVYNDQRWNYQLTIKPEGYPFDGSYSITQQPNYTIRFYAVNHDFGNIRHEVEKTHSVSYTVGSKILSNSKRVYLGAHALGHTGSILTETDLVFDSFRVWMDELNNESIKQHNLDPSNYGHDKIYNNTTIFNLGISDGFEIPGYDSLVLHWNFDQNSSADSSGEFTVEDFSSGSAEPDQVKYGATATIIFSDSDGGASIAVDQSITIISTDGTSRTYVAKAANDYSNNQFDKDGDYDDIAAALKGAIEHASGHNGKIIVSIVGEDSNALFLQQAVGGKEGNTTITENLADVTVTNFTGGHTVHQSAYGWASNILEREHKGRALGFPANDTNPVKTDMIYARRKELPEISFTNDKVTIVGNQEEYFIEDEDTTDNVFALEKSMYQSISEEMIRTFSTMKEFSNLFLKPVEAYRLEYKKLRIARGLFFDRINDNPDLDKYTNYFKWIDSSLTFFIEQLKPASVTFLKGVGNIVESHIFERPKYVRKFPTVDRKSSTQGVVKGRGERDYNWKFGHSPEYKNGGLNDHSLWRKERESRASNIDNVQKVITTEVPDYNTYLSDNDGNLYLRSTYVTRRFGRQYKINYDLQNTIHGGVNYNQNKNRDFIHDVIRPHGSKTNLGIPVNVAVVGVGPGQGIVNTNISNDIVDPNKVDEFNFTITVGKDSSNDGSVPATASLDYIYKVKGHYAAPFNLISGSESRGANKEVFDNYSASVVLTNLHSDTTYLQNDIPMQGPFTQTWVGGHQSRHVQVNRYDTDLKSEGGAATLNNLDDQYSRPEAYRILFGEHPDESVQDGALGIVGPDYGGPYPDSSRRWAVYYRDFRAKRPYNIQNLSGSERVHGNYKEKYEYFNTVGRLENNNRLKKAASIEDYQISGNFLPTQIQQQLPATTHPLTLMSIAASSSGNVFGVGESNRINDALEIAGFSGFSTGSFQITGSTIYNAPYTGSFRLQPPPVAPQASFLSFAVATGSSLVNANVLQLTGSGVNKQIEVDTAGSGYLTDTDIVLPTYRQALRANSTVGAPAADNSYSGLNSSGFSLSFWVNNGDSSATNSAYILFRSGTDLKHYIRIYDDMRIYFENSGGSNDFLDFDTNSQTVSGSQWMHVVAVFEVDDLSDNAKAPKLWANGSQVTSSGGSSYTAPGAGTPTINDILIQLDDSIAFQDVTIWNTLLTGSEAVSQLYNGGVWKDPTTHASASSINDYYKFGEEYYWNDIGYKAGDTLDDIGGSINRFISSSYGTGNNSLEIDADDDQNFLFIKGKGDLTNDEIWNKLTSSLNVGFSGWNTTYISGSESAKFFLQKDNSGFNTVTMAETGTSFTSLVSGSGANPIVSTLKDQEAIQIGTSYITASHTTSASMGSSFKIIPTANTYRKGLRFIRSNFSNREVSALNENYTNPTSTDWLSVSWWMQVDNDNERRVWEFDQEEPGGSEKANMFTRTTGGQFQVYLYNSGSSTFKTKVWDLNLTDNTSTNPSWNHYTYVWHRVQAIGSGSSHNILYKNGVPLSLTSMSTLTGETQAPGIKQVYIGGNDASDKLQQNEGLQDFVIWNGYLDEESAQILYNSGSWFDCHGHPSASYIWDWWLLGNEANITQELGEELDNGSAVTSISPEIGRHVLTFNNNAQVEVQDGIAETLKPHATFWSDAETLIEAETAYSVTNASNSSGYSVLTLDAEGHGLDSTLLSPDSTTFTNISAITRGSDYLTKPIGGAIDDEYLQIGSTRFIIDSNNSNAGGNFAKVGDHYYVYSSGSTTSAYLPSTFWTRLSGAIFQEFPSYKIYFGTETVGAADTKTTFQLTSSISNTTEDRAITESGTSYTIVSPKVTGSSIVYESGLINVTQRESDFLTGSVKNRTVITSRFSAPGGVEVQTYGYLDAYAREYSVYNSLNYRNLSVRGSGSGENGTIRVNSQANTRDGLRTLYQRPMGPAGTDSTIISVDSSDYEYSASFHKVPKNTLVTPRSGSSTVEIVERSNNYNYSSVLPASDYNYSWTTSSLGDNYSVRSGTQKVFGYWPKDGLNRVNGSLDSAITFPTASEIYATYGE